MNILVTGASGFVGGPTCLALLAAGHVPVAALRAPMDMPDTITVQTVAAGMAACTDWRDALAGMEAVVHLAARVHVMDERAADPLAEFRITNTAGTLRLAEQAAEAGLRHFVFMSTIKVCGEETTPGQSFGPAHMAPKDAYGRSKAEAEVGLAELASRTGMAVTVLRPPLVYGPGVKGNLASLLKVIDRGLPLPLASVDNQRSLIGIGNLADSVRAILDSRPQPGSFRVYPVCDGESVSSAELVRRLASALDHPARLLPVPVTLLRLAGRLTGRGGAIQRLTSSLVVDNSAIGRDLGWVPPFTLDQGLAQMAAWWRTAAGRRKDEI